MDKATIQRGSVLSGAATLIRSQFGLRVLNSPWAFNFGGEEGVREIKMLIWHKVAAVSCLQAHLSHTLGLWIIWLFFRLWGSHLLPHSSIWIAVEVVHQGSSVCNSWWSFQGLWEVRSRTNAEQPGSSPWCWENRGSQAGCCWELSVVLWAIYFCKGTWGETVHKQL